MTTTLSDEVKNAWKQRIRDYVSNRAAGSELFKKTSEDARRVLEATKPEGLNLQSMDLVFLASFVIVYLNAVDTQTAGRRRKTVHRRKKTHRRRA